MNGGRTWRRSRPIAGVAGTISWVTAQTGYGLTYDGAAAGSVPNKLCRTTDSGLHWRLVEYNHLGTHSPSSLPGCNGLTGISFQSVSSGWATGMCGPAPQILMLYVTHDGSRHWHQHRLSPPRGMRSGSWSLAPPAFFGSAGVLPVVVGPPASFDLYLTRDAGTSWSPTTSIRARNPLTAPDAFALTPGLAWAWLDNTLYATKNGSGSWGRLAHLPFAAPPELDFLTPRIGFALGMVGGRGEPAWILRMSRDGGRTWQTVRPVLRDTPADQ